MERRQSTWSPLLLFDCSVRKLCNEANGKRGERSEWLRKQKRQTVQRLFCGINAKFRFTASMPLDLLRPCPWNFCDHAHQCKLNAFVSLKEVVAASQVSPTTQRKYCLWSRYLYKQAGAGKLKGLCPSQIVQHTEETESTRCWFKTESLQELRRFKWALIEVFLQASGCWLVKSLCPSQIVRNTEETQDLRCFYNPIAFH